MSDRNFLLITPDFPPSEGGVARYLSSLAAYFRRDIEVACEPHPQWQTFDPMAGYPIYRRPLLSNWMYPRWFASVAYLRAYRDRYRTIVVSHVLPFGTAAMVAGWFTKTPYVVIVHGMDIRLATRSPWKRFLAASVLRHARVVVANSQALANELARVFGLNEVLVVYPCIENVVPPTPHPSHSMFRLLTVSRLVERKGHAVVLNALAMLKSSGQVGSWHYDIVGDGPLAPTLRSMVEELGLEDAVTMHGAVNDAARDALYQQADLFVMPVSNDPVDKEGFGIVYLEAARYGIPSIATRVPGVDEAVVDGITGILLDSQDPTLLAQTIVRLAQDRPRLEELGRGARSHAAQFTCEAQLEKLRPFL